MYLQQPPKTRDNVENQSDTAVSTGIWVLSMRRKESNDRNAMRGPTWCNLKYESHALQSIYIGATENKQL